MTCSRHPGLLAMAILLLGLRSANADAPISTILSGVGLEQHLNQQLPLDLPLVDETGRAVRLGDYFAQRPVILVFAYYRCPMLCTQVLNGMLKASQAMPLELGQDYQIVTVSIDEREGPELAAAKKDRYVRAYRRAGAAEGWHFLVGSRESVEQLTAAVGYRYRYDAASDQFAHPSGIIVATPQGRLAQYFYGIDYPPGHLRLSLVESAAGQIGSVVDQVLLLCYHYDPKTGKYGLAIANIVRAAGSLTVLALGSFIGLMLRQERRRAKENLLGPAAIDQQPPGGPQSNDRGAH